MYAKLMPSTGYMTQIPLPWMFALSLGLALTFWEIGYRLGHRRIKKGDVGAGSSINTQVSIIVGLVAFLLAFTFNMAASRFQDRRDVLIEDVNAIGTTFLRTKTIAEPERSKLQELLRQYVDNRINISSSEDLDARMQRTNELYEALWQETAAVAEKDRSPVAALFIDTMNQMIDMHTKRLTIMMFHRVPDPIWMGLLLLTILGIAFMGYQNGLLDRGRSPAFAIVALMFAIVISMIADLDNPAQGRINVDQQPMIELRRAMN